jgi:hypothetical protein
VQLDVGLAVAARAHAGAEEAACFIAADGTPAGAGHAAAARVNLGGLADADADRARHTRFLSTQRRRAEGTIP